MPETFAEIALVMFVGMGPIKVLVFYLGAIRDATPAVAREVAVRAVAAATVTALALVLVGSLLMRLLHFSNEALIVAAGIVLLAYGLQMVLVTTPGGPQDRAPTRTELLRMAIYPMGVPLILNPAGVAGATLFSAEATSVGDLGLVVVVVLALAVLDLAVLLVIRPIGHRLRPEVILVLEKLLGVLLVAVAVELILVGLGQLGIITISGH